MLSPKLGLLMTDVLPSCLSFCFSLLLRASESRRRLYFRYTSNHVVRATIQHFSTNISPNVNVIRRLEFKHAYDNVAVQHGVFSIII